MGRCLASPRPRDVPLVARASEPQPVDDAVGRQMHLRAALVARHRDQGDLERVRVQMGVRPRTRGELGPVGHRRAAEAPGQAGGGRQTDQRAAHAHGGYVPRVAGRERKGVSWLAASVAWAVPMFALWLALTDNTRPLELAVGGACALIAGAAAEASGLAGRVHSRPRARWLVRALAIPWWIARDAVLVLGTLARGRPEGRIVVVAFRSRGETSRDVARRAIAYSAGSAGPNTSAIGGSPDADVLVAHQLVPSDSVTPAEIVAEP